MTELVFNIAAATGTELIDLGSEKSFIKSMLITNTDASNDAEVDLWLRNAAGTDYYICKKLSLPVGTTLKLESDEVSFNNQIYNMYISSTRTADVIINLS